MNLPRYVLGWPCCCKRADPFQSGNQVLEFLRNFYDVFPEYKGMDVRVALSILTLFNDALFRRIWLVKVMLVNLYPILVTCYTS